MEILDRTKVFQGHLIDVEKVCVRLPDSAQRDYELVNHANAVTILPIDQDGNIYFVEQYRLGAEKVLLELPAGVMDPGEDPAFSAQRELREETGFASNNLKELTRFYMIAGYGDEMMYGFLAQDLYSSPLTPDADENLKLISIPLDEVYKMLFNNEFADAKTIVLLSLAIPHLLQAFPALHQTFKK